jgi:phospholipid/cholesterol/gamma-HCH transport system substrate-binding protein
MNSYYREATVGVLVLAGVGVFLAATLWLQGQSVFGGGPDLLVRFDDIGTLKEGSPVRTSGAQIGRVATVTFEGPGNVVVAIEFDVANIQPTSNATVSLAAIGMLGDMVVDFLPGDGAPLAEGEMLVGSLEPGLFDKGASLADQAAVTMASLNRMLDTALIGDLRRTLSASERLMRYYADRDDGPTAELNTTLRALQSVTARFDTTLAGIDAPALAASLDSTLQAATTMTNRLAGMTARMDSLLGRINRGEGTLGKLVADSALYTELTRTMAATRALVDSLSAHPERLGITVRVF